MRSITGSKRRRLVTAALAAACAIAGGSAVWHASPPPAEASSADRGRAHERLRKGVGSEVRFAKAADGPEQVDEAVASVDEFIYRRSGLRMSGETKKRLAKAESDVLRGKSPHITLAELTDELTAAVVGRLATLADEEIEQAAEASADGRGDVRSRADGRWGVMTKESLTRQARAGREWGRRGDTAPRAALHSMIEGEVNSRAATLGEALPEGFGGAGGRGVTPTQALLVAYSVAADDPLTDSRGDLERMLVERRMEARLTREEAKARKNVSGRPYGARGWLHPSAAHLFLMAGADALLRRAEGGKK